MKNIKTGKKCKMCGKCCKLFIINLSEKEYRSGKYKTMFEEFKTNKKFSEVQKFGLNLLAQKKDGSCIYLSNKKCKIHKIRPQVCKKFFCTSKNKKFQEMRKIINSTKM